ncbi:hypothetical protein CR513_55021, partial [Mucuna pruriens]
MAARWRLIFPFPDLRLELSFPFPSSSPSPKLPFLFDHSSNIQGCQSSSSSSFTSTSSPKAIAAIPVAMADKAESSPNAPIPLGEEHFEWVYQDVLSYGSKMTPAEVESIAIKEDWICGPHALQLAMTHCSTSERICHVCKEGEGDFAYMYETVLQDLGVTFPLDRFTTDVLRLVGVAPSQLHPNG